MTQVTAMTALTADRLDSAVAMLVRAFLDDPLFVYLAPDEARRSRALRRFFAPTVRYALHYGYVDAVDQGQAGLALWLGPGQTSMSLLGMLRSGMLTAPFAFGLDALNRLGTVSRLTEQVRRRRTPERHWYLLGLGVAPERQGEGIGSALLHHGLSRADADRAPCYLETLRERTARYYERFGFRVVETAPIAPDGPSFWALRREGRGEC